jgi:light-regulated signal transduction histidine kinase (bacteriophytochrome)
MTHNKDGELSCRRKRGKAQCGRIEYRMTESGREKQELNRIVLRGLHDLQEPLGNVIRYLSFVEARYKGRLDREANEFISEAVDGANRIRQIITDLQKRVENS